MSVFESISPVTLRHPDLPGGEIVLPNDPRVSVSIQKTVVTTPVAGRDFAVVEIISAQNYRIRIEGISDPIEDNVLPEETIRLLNILIRINASLEVECEYMAIYGIRQMVLEGLDTDASEFAGQLTYRLDAISDDPIELEILREDAIFQ